MIEHLTEATVNSNEKLMSLIKQTDKSSKLIIDNRSMLSNESSSKFTSMIYRISLDYTKKLDKKQNSNLQILIVDFPQSDTINLCKKNDITNTQKKQNQSKGITTFVNVINKLSLGHKANFSFRESKLTKVLYQNFNHLYNNQFNKIFFCFLNQNSENMNEAVNVINFANKLKRLTSKKNESSMNTLTIFDEKSNFLSENVKLKSKIKELEELVNEKESIPELKESKIERNQESQSKKMTDVEMEVKNN